MYPRDDLNISTRSTAASRVMQNFSPLEVLVRPAKSFTGIAQFRGKLLNEPIDLKRSKKEISVSSNKRRVCCRRGNFPHATTETNIMIYTHHPQLYLVGPRYLRANSHRVHQSIFFKVISPPRKWNKKNRPAVCQCVSVLWRGQMWNISRSPELLQRFFPWDLIKPWLMVLFMTAQHFNSISRI